MEDEFFYETDSAQFNRLKEKKLDKLSFILYRMPSMILLEYILLNSDVLYTEVNSKFGGSFNFIIVWFIAKFFLAISLAACFLMFILKLDYVLIAYKLFGLVSLPFLFTSLINYFETATFHYILKLACLLFVYAFIASLTMYFYSQVYQNFILDRFRTHEKYQLNRNENLEQVNNYFDRLTVVEENTSSLSYESDEDMIPQVDLDTQLKRRRIFILFYMCCSFFLNDSGLFLTNYNSKTGLKEKFNIISLGFYLLFFYDLTANLDQMIFRFLIKSRHILGLINEFGLTNLISFNWFQRLRVPSMLRLYFLLKCYFFAFKFLIHYNYYFNLNMKMIEQNTRAQTTQLGAYILGLFNATPPVSNYDEEKYASYLKASSFENDDTLAIVNVWNELFRMDYKYMLILYFKMLTLNLSETFVSIGATTSIISYQFYLIGIFVNKLTYTSEETHVVRRPAATPQQVVGGGHNDNELLNAGDVAAILFFLLSIQSGLTSLNGLVRIEKFCKNYSLLFIAILHFFHTTLDGKLMSLSASSKADWKSKKHLKVIGVCFSLIFIPIFLLIYIWNRFQVSTWLLAVFAFNIELIVKMSVTIILYAIFIIDSKRITSSYEKILKDSTQNMSNTGQENKVSTDELADNLDDYVYFIKGFGHIMEFIIALFLFFNGAYILFFESYGAVRAIMMCIHAYFHIWMQARKGWKVFIKRRTAIAKLKLLTILNKTTFNALVKRKNLSINLEEEEEKEELSNEIDNSIREKDDEDEFEKQIHEVCAICFCELCAHEARITNCNHMFHSICLRKWLYLQDTCPMCHQIVYPNLVASSPKSGSS